MIKTSFYKADPHSFKLVSDGVHQTALDLTNKYTQDIRCKQICTLWTLALGYTPVGWIKLETGDLTCILDFIK